LPYLHVACRLLFATDYSHWDFDDSGQALSIRLTEAQHQAVFSDFTRALYRQE
jgi:hypothetical protein